LNGQLLDLLISIYIKQDYYFIEDLWDEVTKIFIVEEYIRSKN